jgi:hypothetical protein
MDCGMRTVGRSTWNDEALVRASRSDAAAETAALGRQARSA